MNVQEIQARAALAASREGFVELALRVERCEAALREIVRREARSEYSSIYAAPGEFAALAREALNGQALAK